MTRVLLIDRGIDEHWPYVRERFEARVREFAELVTAPQVDDLHGADALAFAWSLDDAMLDGADKLRVVGGVYDHAAEELLDLVSRRGIPLIDATRAWAPSVAEVGLGLILCALRRIPLWHHQVMTGEAAWPMTQFCDDSAFVNGELGTKTVGVLGLGAIGSRIAAWSGAIGADVVAHDPFAGPDRFAAAGARSVDADGLVEAAEILVIAVPPTPSAAGLIDRKRVQALRRGAWVVSVTRAWALDTDALRERVIAGELGWASDVWDVEPLPDDDPLVGRDNVVHLPHIAGRTREANHRVADLLADDFRRVLDGRPPVCALTPEQVRVRTRA